MKLTSSPSSLTEMTYAIEIKSGDVVLSLNSLTPQVYWSAKNDKAKIINNKGGVVTSSSISGNSWRFFDQRQVLLWQFVFPESKDDNATWIAVLGNNGVISFSILGSGVTTVVDSSFRIPSDLCKTLEPCGPYNVCSGKGVCTCVPGLARASPDCKTRITSPCEETMPLQLVDVGYDVNYFALGFAPPLHKKTDLDGCKGFCNNNCSCLGIFFQNSSGNCFLFRNIIVSKVSEKGFLIRIPSDVTRRRVISQGVWIVDNQAMFVGKYEPGMKRATPALTSVSVWLDFRGVPHQYHSAEGLELIASMLGNLLFLHPTTSFMTNMDIARVFTVINPLIPLPEAVNVEFPNGDIERIEVSCPWMPPTCEFCKEIGHSQKRCPSAPITCLSCKSMVHDSAHCTRAKPVAALLTHVGTSYVAKAPKKVHASPHVSTPLPPVDVSSKVAAQPVAALPTHVGTSSVTKAPKKVHASQHVSAPLPPVDLTPKVAAPLNDGETSTKELHSGHLRPSLAKQKLRHLPPRGGNLVINEARATAPRASGKISKHQRSYKGKEIEYSSSSEGYHSDSIAYADQRDTDNALEDDIHFMEAISQRRQKQIAKAKLRTYS